MGSTSPHARTGFTKIRGCIADRINAVSATVTYFVCIQIQRVSGPEQTGWCGRFGNLIYEREDNALRYWNYIFQFCYKSIEIQDNL